MTPSGWYADPSGKPNTLRYWDGTAWTEHEMPAPASTPTPTPPPAQTPPQTPPPAPPAPPAQPPRPTMPLGPNEPTAVPGVQPWQPTPSNGPKGGVIALIIAAAVLVVAAVGVGGYLIIRAATGDGTKATTTTAGSPTPTAQGDGGDTGQSASPSAAQCQGSPPLPGRRSGSMLVSGGLTMPDLADQGYAPLSSVTAFPFTDEFVAVSKTVAKSWASTAGVGAVSRAGLSSPAQAAKAVSACAAAAPALYRDVTGVKTVSAEPTQVAGHDAVTVVTEIHVADPDTDSHGDLLRVVVVDTGASDTYGLFMMSSNLGDAAGAALTQRTATQLGVQ